MSMKRIGNLLDLLVAVSLVLAAVHRDNPPPTGDLGAPVAGMILGFIVGGLLVK